MSYLETTVDQGILSNARDTFYLEIYTDSEYVGSIVDCRSAAGYCSFLYGNLITWKKQTMVFDSSAEVELRALVEGISQGMWIKVILEELDIIKDGCIQLYCSIKSAIDMAHNPVQHDRIKHIDIDRHFENQKLDTG